MLEYIERELKGRITGSAHLPDSTWVRITSLASRVQPEAAISGRAVELDWTAFLSMAARLSDLRKQFGFRIDYSPDARSQLMRFREEYDTLRAPEATPSFSPDTIQEQLGFHGFGIPLKIHQRRDVVHIAAQRNGASFSVPGAGKTTVAFAVYLLTRTPETCLLVVAPKNAFSAWDDVIEETLVHEHPAADFSPFIRLEGGAEAIRAALRDEPARTIISYDQVIRVADILADYMRTHRVHMIVDESHRMKAGAFSQRRANLLSLAHLPARRDILSGTPIPNSLLDIAPQIDFLWPGQGIGRRVLESDHPSEILRPLYVRTTKHELELPPIIRKYIPVEMSPAQLALYSLARAALLQKMVGISPTANVDLGKARVAVIRLLQIASNPILAVRSMTSEQVEDSLHVDETLETVFRRIVEERDSRKIGAAIRLVREILSTDANARVIVWSAFRENVERLTELLTEYGATFIHGDVPVGAANDPNTREGRIRRFHAPDLRCRVLVANPAACSEGISLHRVCHNAIYVDRTYNAAHYLQSVDRIHRLGLEPGTDTFIYVLESIAPGVIGSIDYSVRRRLITKLNMMATALEDIDLRQLALDEQEGDEPIDYDITLDDIVDLINELSGTAHAPDEE
jgi:SNF2 family DNA or RNA helicase